MDGITERCQEQRGDSIDVEGYSEPRLRHTEPGHGETRISYVSLEPGCRVVFGSHEPGSLAAKAANTAAYIP
jgi:hypothetical protein